MENAVKQFARKVLLVHLALLVALLALMVLASREVYHTARAHTLQQAEQRQALLAEQTARGIQSLYESVLSDLELMHPVDPDDPNSSYATPPVLPDSRPAAPVPPRQVFPTAVLSQQLEGRLSHLFVVDRQTLRTRWVGIGATESAPSIKQIVGRTGNWIKNLQDPAISDFQLFGERGVHLIGIPLNGPRKLNVLVAAIPVWRIERRFLDELNRHNVGNAFLIDDDLTLVAAARHDLVGSSLAQAAGVPLKSALTSLVSDNRRGTRVMAEGFSIGAERFAPSLLTAQPVRVSDKRWFVLISSPLSEVDGVVSQLFRRALYWAIFVVCSMTAILVSTSVQLIRGRARLERVRHEVLTREMQEARRIQLAWLPERGRVSPGLEIATVNHPASHISGDFYNFFDLPDGRTALVIGDVTGHGMSAAFLMATAQLLVRTGLPGYCDPAACLAEVNRQLCIQMFNGQFVTMLIAIVDRDARRLQISSAGHPAPLVDVGQGFARLPMDSGLLLGVERDAKYKTQTFNLAPRTSLLLYTDGVVEAEAPDLTRLGVEGLASAMSNSTGSSQELVDNVVRAVTDFRKSRDLIDDMTVVCAIVETADITHEPQLPTDSPATEPWPQATDVNPATVITGESNKAIGF